VEGFRQAIKQVDVVSPNAEEFMGFFTGKLDYQAQAITEVLGWGIGRNSDGALVIRKGKYGCSIFSRGHQISINAYHSPSDDSQSKVVDPTGGGNAFLGALTFALSGDSHSYIPSTFQSLHPGPTSTAEMFLHLAMAAIYATVAASFVIEQPGMPAYSFEGDTTETWNGESFEARLRAYIAREESFLSAQILQEAKQTECCEP
jgi:sugar/nucleoside kinase (ribokinase family)